MVITRRSLFERVGRVGGAGAMLAVMSALGFPGIPSAGASPLNLPPEVGRGHRVLVLGAGIAGLVSAYEMRKAGFEVIVLEARQRVGGRNWSVRGGTAVEFTDGTTQACTFDPGFYMNAGPARIPSHHTLMHGYCSELGVPLEVEVNSSRSAFVLPEKGDPIQLRRIFNDSRGYISELLAKSANQGALDQQLSADDKKRLIEFLRAYGDLTADLQYKGSERAGLATRPGAAAQRAKAIDPLPLAAVLNPALITPLIFEELTVMQPTMFQPVGGMDQIPEAFYRELRPYVRLGAVVKEIRNGSRDVTVGYEDTLTGQSETIAADYLITTLPLPVLAGIKTNFDARTKKAIAAVETDHASKIAWQSPRFWETQSEVFGGLSFVEGEINVVWYPSSGFHTPEGVLIGCYNSGEKAARFTSRPLAEQFAISRSAIDRMHPGGGKLLARPLSVQWKKIPFSLGPWVHFEDSQAETYALLNQPQGRVHMAADYLTHVSGWQEGAASSARRAVTMIAERIQAEPALRRAS